MVPGQQLDGRRDIWADGLLGQDVFAGAEGLFDVGGLDGDWEAWLGG